MREAFERRQRVSAAPDRVWEALLDFNRVAGWIEIVGAAEEIVPHEHYRAVLEDRLGPFRLRADLEVRLSDIVQGVSLPRPPPARTGRSPPGSRFRLGSRSAPRPPGPSSA